MTGHCEPTIVFSGVSRFYGEVLGVMGVDLLVEAGITSLVGPNGSGKSTVMNLITGLIQPTTGKIRVLGIDPSDSEALLGRVGYCSQFDSFPRGMTGGQFIDAFLRVHGFDSRQAEELTAQALEVVGLDQAAARRKIASYSKGMRQRIKLAQALAHRPQLLVLDEPLNGLDPLARAEIIGLFRSLAEQGLSLVISSHILHEVDLLSDQVVLLKGGRVLAEGEITAVRSEIREHPLQINIRCSRPQLLASQVFGHDSAVEVRLHDDRRGLLVSTTDAPSFYLLLNRLVLEHDLEIESVAPADENVHAVYRYLVGGDSEDR